MTTILLQLIAVILLAVCTFLLLDAAHRVRAQADDLRFLRDALTEAPNVLYPVFTAKEIALKRFYVERQRLEKERLEGTLETVDLKLVPRDRGVEQTMKEVARTTVSMQAAQAELDWMIDANVRVSRTGESRRAVRSQFPNWDSYTFQEEEALLNDWNARLAASPEALANWQHVRMPWDAE